MAAIEAVVFDYGRTLVTFEYPAAEVIDSKRAEKQKRLPALIQCLGRTTAVYHRSARVTSCARRAGTE